MRSNNLYNEQELLLRIAEGNENAFSQLFNKEYPAVYNAAFMVTASTLLAEEVVQDVFLKIWIKRADLINVNNFRSYLFIIARNQAYRALRKQLNWQALRKQDDQDQEQPDLFDLQDHLTTDQLITVYEAAIEQLPEQQKQVFRLSKQQGMRRNEVAVAMNIQPDTVKKYLAAAILNIRAYCHANAGDLLPELITATIFLHSFGDF